MDRSLSGELRRELSARLDIDAYAAGGGYGVSSLYYDTDRLRFYWEKVEA